MTYLFQLFALLVVAFSVAKSYYGFPIHVESYTGYSYYFIMMLLVYSVYKLIQLFVGKNKVRFTPLKIAGYALLHIFILCATFFDIANGSGTLILFMKIVGYSVLPLVITLIGYSFSKKILGYIPGFRLEHEKFQTITHLGMGFIFFLTPIIIAGILGQYNLWVVFGTLLLYSIIAYREIIETSVSLGTYTIEYDNHRATDNFFENINSHLLSTEFLFIILTFLIGVNLINIVRPMPIGWDDLGVYMNFPNIIAQNGKILAGNGMIIWQTFTGIGFMFRSTAQAFFLSDLGGILSLIVTGLSLSYFIGEKKKHFINLPLFACTILFAMPMVIFQQAKDIKVDLGLFFMSVVTIFVALYLALKYLGYTDSSSPLLSTEKENASKISGKIIDSKTSSKQHFDNLESEKKPGLFGMFSSVFKGENGDIQTFDGKLGLYLILIVGILAGFAFGIKMTSLMLILGIIGVFAYVKIGLSGFMGYFFLFIGFFTKFHLWDMMNVNYPKDNLTFINTTFIISLILGVTSLGYGAWKYGYESLKRLGIMVSIFFLGIGLSLSPWLLKNMHEVGIKNISIGALLNGKGEEFVPDYTKIHDKQTLDAINQKQADAESISSSGKTTNEDLGRYFGYENGINNYLKLPYNLTMQTNQPGEYTDLTFLFLALLPVMLLFLGYRHPAWSLGIVVGIIFAGVYYFTDGIGGLMKQFFATQDLPMGYLWIIGAFLLPLPYFLYSLNRSRNSQLFRLLLVFSTLYCLLFVIAAYGIVWYGIAMYFVFLAMIVLAGERLSLDDGTVEKENIFRFIGSISLILIGSIYFFNSSFPHGFKNLSGAGFNDYKSGQVTQSEGIFNSHPDYYTLLTELNLANKNVAYEKILSEIKNPSLLAVIKQYANNDINRLEGVLREVIKIDPSKVATDPLQAQVIQASARTALNDLYEMVLYPPQSLRNTKNIYRIGTFLTYFIDNNRTRYYDDSLISAFDTYFYDKDPDVTIERMKKIGLSYLLVDLNAATIDRDPRHDLTRRYENLLSTFKSSKLELVQTDSLCLHLAIDEKDPNYLTYAGVNFESYTDGKTINRKEKFYNCMQHVAELAQAGKITTDGKFSYLAPFVQFIQANGKNLTAEKFSQAFDAFHGWLALFRIK